MIGPMELATTTRFALAARTLSEAARSLGLRPPGFRSPPALVGVDRTLRFRGGRPTVAVRVRGRPWVPVLSDMIEGVVAANHLIGPPAARAREALWSALTPELGAGVKDQVSSEPVVPAPVVSEPRVA